MDASVIAALITAGASLVVAAAGVVLAVRDRRRTEQLATVQQEHQTDLVRLKAELEREARQEERQLTARFELDRAREPLLAAALDLAHRLNNIRHELFLDAYMTTEGEHRSDVARTSTLYRLGRYWCIVELLYDRVALQQILAEDATKSVGRSLRDIGRTFATDKYDSGRFMMWREEQRAIAELMRADGSELGGIGYATFVARYPRLFSPWFASFVQDLQPAAARASQRFEGLQYLLARLVRQLDVNGLHQDECEKLEAASSPPPFP